MDRWQLRQAQQPRRPQMRKTFVTITALALVPLGAVGCVSKSEYTKTVQAAEAHYNAFDAENTGLKHELAAAGKRRETVVANGGFRVGQISSMLSHPGHLERAARTEFGSS